MAFASRIQYPTARIARCRELRIERTSEPTFISFIRTKRGPKLTLQKER
jgi:hypothetical protein